MVALTAALLVPMLALAPAASAVDCQGTIGGPFSFDDLALHDFVVRPDTPESEWEAAAATTFELDGNTYNVGLIDAQASDPPYGLSIEVPGDGVLHNDISGTLFDPMEDGATVVAPPLHAKSFELRDDGGFTYVPADNYFGADSFTYRVQRNERCSSIGTVTIPSVRVPRAYDNTFPVPQGLSLCKLTGPPRPGPDPGTDIACGVLLNDQNRANAVHKVRAGTTTVDPGQLLDTEHGTVTVFSGGTFEYTPDEGFEEGEDVFYYSAKNDLDEVSLGAHEEGPATGTSPKTMAKVTLVIGDPPSFEAVDDEFTTPEDIPVSGNVFENDNAPDGPPTTFHMPHSPQHGDVDIGGNGQFTYTPDPNFVGTDTFTYNPHILSSLEIGTVAITMTPVNDPLALDLNPACTGPCGDGDDIPPGSTEIPDTRTVRPGQPVQVGGFVTGLDEDTFTLTIDWGDETTDTIDCDSAVTCSELIRARDGEWGFEKLHTYEDTAAATYEVKVRVSNDNPNDDPQEATAVANIVPSAPNLVLANHCSPGPFTICSPFTSSLREEATDPIVLKGRIQDPLLAAGTLRIAWGDGQTTNAPINCQGGVCAVTGRHTSCDTSPGFQPVKECGYFEAGHTYQTPATYPITVEVFENDQELGEATTEAVIRTRTPHTFVVDDDGQATRTSCTDPASTRTSVQAAVNAALAGDTIKVCPGTYTELVTINKSLSLEGAQAGQSAEDGIDDSEPQTVMNNPNGGFDVDADNVTIDGFTLTDATDEFGVLAGIFLEEETSGHSILNNVFTGNPTGLFLDGSGPILVSGNYFDSNNAFQSTFFGLSGTGIFSSSFDRIDNVTISNNGFAGHTTAAMNLRGHSDVTIEGNTMTDDAGIQLAATDGARIVNNRMTGGEGPGIALGAFFDQVTNVEINGNTITGREGDAILVPRTVGEIAITGNTLMNNTGSGVRVGGLGIDGDIEMHFNRIVGNAAGVTHLGSKAIDATNNWWGCNGGPGTTGCDQVTGDGATATDVAPYLMLRLAADPLTTLTTSRLTIDTTHNSDGTDTSALGTLPDGVPIEINSTLGTLSDEALELDAGMATTELATAAANGVANVTAQLDNAVASIDVTLITRFVRVGDVTITEGTGGATTAHVPVELSPVADEPVTVRLSTEDGTAEAGSDYTAATARLITIPAGVNEVVADIPIRTDALDEIDEHFNVVLSDPVSALLPSDADGTVTITDDDQPPALLKVKNANGREGEDIIFTLKLSQASGKTVAVAFSTADNTAVEPGDYVAKTVQVTFAPGQVTKTIAVQTIADSAKEGTEKFYGNFSSPINATIADLQATGMIHNNK